MSRSPLLAVAAVTAALACSDAFAPTIQNVSGLYFARSFTSDSAGVTKDWFGLGATLGLSLNPNGSVAGLLILPRFPNDPAPPIEHLTGTWTLTRDTVHFTQDADTFVRDMDWVVTENRLSGDKTFKDVRIRAVLTKLYTP